jgi:hypothetical protein
MELKSVTYISDWSRNCPFLMILGQSLKGAVIDVALLATHSYKQNSLLSDVRLARSLYFICACRQERLEEAMAGNKKAINGRQRSLVILAIVNQIFLRLGFTFLHCWCLFPVRKTLVNRHVLSPSLHRAARSQPGSVSIRLRLGLDQTQARAQTRAQTRARPRAQTRARPRAQTRFHSRSRSRSSSGRLELGNARIFVGSYSGRLEVDLSRFISVLIF